MRAGAGRPRAVYRDVQSFLGEALRELVESGFGPRREGEPGAAVRVMALSLAFGPEVVTRAVTVRLEDRGPSHRVGVVAGTAVAGVLSRRLGPRSLLSAGAVAAAAGVGWLATVRTVTPLRRRYAEHIHRARLAWEADRSAWLSGKLPREAREAAVDRLLSELCRALADS